MDHKPLDIGFLDQVYSKLHTDPEAITAKVRTKEKTTQEVSDEPKEIIKNLLFSIEKVFETGDLNKIKEYIFQKHYKRDPDLTPSSEVQTDDILEIKNQQRYLLNTWLDHLLADYPLTPIWLKYWAFTSISKARIVLTISRPKFLLKGNKAPFSFTREWTQTFPPLNRNCVTKIIRLVELQESLASIPIDTPEYSVIEKQFIDLLKEDQQLKELVKSRNFLDLYLYTLQQYKNPPEEILENTAGTWKTYDKNSSSEELYNSFQEYSLPWPIATNIDLIQKYLASGKIHIYFSKNEQGQAVVPRLFIREEKHNITEVKGIHFNQEVDQSILPVLIQKLEDFEENKSLESLNQPEFFEKIKIKKNNGKILPLTQLKLLNESGYSTLGLDHPSNNSPKEKKYYYNYLNLNNITSLEGFFLQMHTKSFSSSKDLIQIDDLPLPTFVEANLNFESLPPPESTIKKLNLNGLFSEELDISQIHTESINISTTNSTINLIIPANFPGDVNLKGLTSTKGLIISKNYRGLIQLNSLLSADDLIIPEGFRGLIELNKLQSAKNLIIPENFRGHLSLPAIESAKDLIIPENFSGTLELKGLKSAEHVNIPQSFTGYLDLSRVTSTAGLVIPESFTGDLDLSKLESAENLVIPANFSGYLDLHNLQSVEGLSIPSSFKGILSLRRLKTAQDLIIPENFSGHLDLSGLDSTKTLNIPNTATGNFNLAGIKSAKELTIPENFSGSLELQGLKSAEDLIIPDSFSGVLFLDRLTVTSYENLIARYPQYKENISFWD